MDVRWLWVQSSLGGKEYFHFVTLVTRQRSLGNVGNRSVLMGSDYLSTRLPGSLAYAAIAGYCAKPKKRLGLIGLYMVFNTNVFNIYYKKTQPIHFASKAGFESNIKL